MTGQAPFRVAEALSRLEASVGERPTLGEVMDALGPAGLGISLIVLTIPTLLPMPGVPLGVVFGAALVVVAAQTMLGAEHLGLPGWLRRRGIPRPVLSASSRWLAPRLGWVERRLRPRLTAFTGRTARALLALPVMALAVAIVMPIPFGNPPPAFAIMAIAFGLIAQDGVAVLAGLILGAFALLWTVAVVVFGVEVLQALVA